MKKSLLYPMFFLILCFSSHLIKAEGTGGICPDFPFLKPTLGPLAKLNCAFHHQYELKVKELIQTFGAKDGIPVILNLGGTLVLKYRGTSKTIDISPETYQNIKTLDHTFLAIILALLKQDSQGLNEQTKSYIKALRKHLHQANRVLSSLKLTKKEQQIITQLTLMTNEFLQELVLNKQYKKDHLKIFIQQARPLIFKTTLIAGKIEIDALEAAINPWLAAMEPKDREKIAIVVAASHQAVAGELSVQYFIKKFGARYKVGIVPEDGLVVMQDSFDEEHAFKLLARHFIDREIGTLLADDPTYLQRDVLSEAGTSN